MLGYDNTSINNLNINKEVSIKCYRNSPSIQLMDESLNSNREWNHHRGPSTFASDGQLQIKREPRPSTRRQDQIRPLAESGIAHHVLSLKMSPGWLKLVRREVLLDSAPFTVQFRASMDGSLPILLRIRQYPLSCV